MEENRKEIVEETATAKEVTESEAMTSPVAESAEAPEKKPARRRKTPQKKAAVEDVTEKTPVLRLKTSLRHGFQLKGRYFSRTELGRKSVLEKLYKQYPGLFEK